MVGRYSLLAAVLVTAPTEAFTPGVHRPVVRRTVAPVVQPVMMVMQRVRRRVTDSSATLALASTASLPAQTSHHHQKTLAYQRDVS